MGTHEYLNTCGYPHSGYPRRYGAGTSIIFIKRGRDGYHNICTHGYPLTSLVVTVSSTYFCWVQFLYILYDNYTKSWFLVQYIYLYSSQRFKLVPLIFTYTSGCACYPLLMTSTESSPLLMPFDDVKAAVTEFGMIFISHFFQKPTMD